MTKALTTQNAQITTARVEVNTLTISGKQVTLSVFRQLREEALFSRDLTLKGVPWGYVNYHPDKCGDAGEHLHVVWQRGADLLRSRVYAPRYANFVLPWAQFFVEAAIAEGLHMNTHPREREERFGISDIEVFRRHPGLSGVKFVYGGMQLFGEIRPEFARVYFQQASPAYVEEQAREITGEHGSAGAIAALRLPIAEYHAMWAALTALPHLFIAV